LVAGVHTKLPPRCGGELARAAANLAPGAHESAGSLADRRGLCAGHPDGLVEIELTVGVDVALLDACGTHHAHEIAEGICLVGDLHRRVHPLDLDLVEVAIHTVSEQELVADGVDDACDTPFLIASARLLPAHLDGVLVQVHDA